MDLRAKYGTLELKNPVIVAAAGITADVRKMKKAEDAGAAAVVMKSLFEDPVPRAGDPSPHMLVIRRRVGHLVSDSFYSYEQASHFDEFGYAEEIRKAKESLEIPVIASLDCRSLEAWTKYARLVQQAGADAVEVKLCPHGEYRGEYGLGDIVKWVKRSVNIPVIAKIQAQVKDPVLTLLEVVKAGADGAVMFNRFSGLDIDVEKMVPVMHGGIAGFGGPWFIHYSLRWIAQCYGKFDIPISGSGGVGSGEDVVKYILAGASSVQLATLVIFEGYEVLRRVLEQVEAWMQRNEVERLMDVVGVAAKKLLPIDQIDRSAKLIAAINPEKCTGCGRCFACCFREAICREDKNYRVRMECVGCGLCLNVCPVQAISLVKR